MTTQAEAEAAGWTITRSDEQGYFAVLSRKNEAVVWRQAPSLFDLLALITVDNE